MNNGGMSFRLGYSIWLMLLMIIGGYYCGPLASILIFLASIDIEFA